MKPKTGKRMVSKREYAAAKCLAVFLSVTVFACMVAIVVPPVSLPYVCYLEAQEDAKAEAVGGEYDPTFPFCSGGIVFGEAFLLPPLLLATKLLWKRGRKSWKVVQELQPCIFADLHAPESLVRASSEPMQTQEAVLLRAAAEGQERHEEQLVRAVNGQE